MEKLKKSKMFLERLTVVERLTSWKGSPSVETWDVGLAGGVC